MKEQLAAESGRDEPAIVEIGVDFDPSLARVGCVVHDLHFSNRVTC